MYSDVHHFTKFRINISATLKRHSTHRRHIGSTNYNPRSLLGIKNENPYRHHIGFGGPLNQLRSRRGGFPIDRLSNPNKNVPLSRVLDLWIISENIMGKARDFGLREKALNKVIGDFAKYVRSDKLVQTYEVYKDLPTVFSRLNNEWPKFLISIVPEDKREHFNSLCESADLRNPAAWYPAARLMKREIIMHVGPTNSGKTHTALETLSTSASGIYCGPLRMLAQEIHDRFTSRGILCSLMTGERHFEVPGARLTSCTVEMANLFKEYDVAVIDEIQVIGDSHRGWAWTQALLGLRARKIYLCGELSAVPLIQKLVQETGDSLVIKQFDRLAPLQVASTPVYKSIKGVLPGDCVVVFSRKEVFRYKSLIEAWNPNVKCAVVYGALPSETRAEQARLFNDPQSGYDVMVATDAIGMGLNLAIKRIIFTSAQKYNGESLKPLEVSIIKQISGRAGRYGQVEDGAHGQVTSFLKDDLEIIEKNIKADTPLVSSAGLQPTLEMIEAFADKLGPSESLSTLLGKFSALARTDGNLFFLCNLKDQRHLADLIADLPMTLRDRHQFLSAPIPTTSDPSLSHYKIMAYHFAHAKPLPILNSLFASEVRDIYKNAFSKHVVESMLGYSDGLPGTRVLTELFSTCQSQPGVDLLSSKSLVLANSLMGPKRVFAIVQKLADLSTLELIHRAVLAYLWLQARYPDHPTFSVTTPSHGSWLLQQCGDAINLSLQNLPINMYEDRRSVGKYSYARKSPESMKSILGL